MSLGLGWFHDLSLKSDYGLGSGVCFGTLDTSFGLTSWFGYGVDGEGTLDT
jgi:hypothetical protein